MRKIVWRRGSLGNRYQLQETIPLCHPGQEAGDILHNDALTLFNMKGESHTYSWPDDSSVSTRERRNLPVDPSFVKNIRPENPIIQVVNRKSKAKPYMIFEPGSRMRVYVGRVRERVSNFPAYHHWPVSQVLSDGRFALASDRVTSFSICYVTPPRYESSERTYWSSLLYGTTEESGEGLVSLASSWLQPPELKVRASDFKSEGYDLGQRAYILKCKEAGKPSVLEFELAASDESPLVNVCLIIKGWGDTGVTLKIDDNVIARGKNFRLGYVRSLEGTDLVVWIKEESTKPVKITLSHDL